MIPSSDNTTRRPLMSPEQLIRRYKSTSYVIYFIGALALFVFVLLTERPYYAIYKYVILLLSYSLVLGIPTILIAKYVTKTPIYRAARVFCWLFIAASAFDYVLLLLQFSYLWSPTEAYTTSMNSSDAQIEQLSPQRKLTNVDQESLENSRTQAPRSSPCDEIIGPVQDYIFGQHFQALKEPLELVDVNTQRHFAISVAKSEKGSIVLYIKALGDGNCIQRGADIALLFQDEDILTLNFIGHVGCDDLLMSFFGGIWRKQPELEKLKSKLPQSLQMKYQNSFVELKFPIKKAQAFRSAFRCLSD